ncbi:hypothetical protein RJ639_001474 [Escallonia herrerae]|uniref:Uncharacterized protein n=1 Tax=Escallonia herrerae TaxID=1293975 RepID=A0AA88X8P6_9ASTE|nr:hypothetical protein RJ639_001474 [Escallonia herrerae]
MKGFTEAADSEVRARNVAAQLTIGCTVVTYMKLRSLHLLDLSQMDKVLRKPKEAETLEIPAPFALAISHLGLFKVSSRTDDLKVGPTFSAADAANFGLPQGSKWSAPLYAQAVEYAKSLGLQFTTVDLNGKIGSSWWLYKQNVEEDFFSLDCIIPEDNYTPETAVLHTLWCINEESGFHNEFVDLSPLGTHVYGSMLRNPHAGINLDTYFAIEEARNFPSSLEVQLYS